jgi:hypothetical protein
MITHEDVMELKRVFDDRYVKQDYCAVTIIISGMMVIL